MKRLCASAWKKYKMAKATAREKRSAFLQKQAKLQDEEGHENLAKKIREIDKSKQLQNSQRRYKTQ